MLAFDIHRGRLNGIPNYYEIRKIYYKYPDECTDIECDLYYGIDPQDLNDTVDDISIFNKITSNNTLALELQSLYEKVDNIDAIVGLLCEDKENDATDLLPRTIQNVILKQYLAKRDGDRFWYENDEFTSKELRKIRRTSLGDILERNLEIENLPSNVFYVPNRNNDGNNARNSNCD